VRRFAWLSRRGMPGAAGSRAGARPGRCRGWRPYANCLRGVSVTVLKVRTRMQSASLRRARETQQPKRRVNSAMPFLKCKQYVILDKINVSITGFCSLLHYVNSRGSRTRFPSVTHISDNGHCLRNDLHYEPLRIKSYHGRFVIKVIPSNNISCNPTN